jgi:hypothetical protein
MTDCGCELEEAAEPERRTLWNLLAVNGVMFIAEAIGGKLRGPRRCLGLCNRYLAN